MPPKQAKKSDDDFSDLAVLPKAHIFKFSLVFEQFFTEANRAKVQAKVQEGLVICSGEKVKLLTREEITAYGKGKNQLPDKTAQGNLPEENPLKNLTPEELMSRVAADKLFEMTVLVRRSKKEKITKLEEEAVAAKAAGASEEEQTRLENLAVMAADDYDLDAMFYLVDFPQTQEEALAFAKYSHTLNGVFQINEVQKVVTAEDAESEEGEEDEEGVASRAAEDDVVVNQEQKQQEEEVKEQGDSPEECEKASTIISQLMNARTVSTANSPLRQMAFLKVPFVDESVLEEEVHADSQDPVEKRRASEDVFMQELITQHLDKYGQFFVQYLKFREIVTVEPLMPDKKALSELQCLKEEELVYQDQKQELDAQYDEIQAEFAAEREKYDGEELEQVEKEFEGQINQIEDDQKKLAEIADHRRVRMNQLTVRKKVSIDEERNFDNFSINTYQKDFVDNHETANKISSVLSAMITQIDTHPEQRDGQPCRGTSVAETTVETENLDDMFEHFGKEISCDLKLGEREPDAPEKENPSIQLQNRYNKDLKLHEESDRTLEVQQSLPLKLIEDEGPRVQQISSREHEVLSNLNLPGKNRYLMPTIPAKSKRARDFENPQFYPFCTLSHDEAERVLMLRAMQQLVRSNFIDNAQRGEQKHHKFKVFERVFENHMKPEIFKQVFAEALLDEPDMASMYYQRTDSLIVSLYHKAKPEGSTDQVTPMGDNLDGERNWRSSYRVVPDFQNWLTYFSDELVFEQEPVSMAKKDAENLAASQPQTDTTGNRTVGGFMKYQMDEDAMPEKMLDIEDDKVQSIAERSGLLYPDDNSIMRVDNFTLGGKDFTKSIVCKDNFRFGLRAKSNQDCKRQEFYGLVSYNFVGDTEFWLQFENGTRLGVEQINLQRNEQKTIRIDPTPPTAEEIAAKIELKKQYDIAVQKSQRSGGKIAVDIVIPKTPEPTWESEPLTHLDELFTDENLDCDTILATLTLNNGLFIQYLGNGFVSQTVFGNERLEGKKEVNRICTKYGAIIRQFANRDSEVLYPDGEVAHFKKTDMSWTIINNKGKRRFFKDGVMRDIEPIPCACESDPETHAMMMIREDDVVSVRYADRGYFCQHADGTQMYTAPDGSEIRIEKPGFASHKLRLVVPDEEGTQKNKNSNLLKVEERSVDGRIVETFLPDGSMSQTYLDNVPVEEGGTEQRYRHIIKRADLSVVILDSTGNISLVSSNTRASLCEAGTKTKVDHSDVDKDYLAELSRPSGTFIPGVYQALISSAAGVSCIRTKNSRDDTCFMLKHDNKLTKFNCKKEQAPETASKKSKQYQSNIIGDMELEETGGFKNPLTRQYQYPRFFVIQGDGSARELISADQLAYAMRKKKVQADQSIKQKMSDVHNNATVENHYFLTKVVNMKETEIEHQKLRDLEFPMNAQNALEKKEANKQREEIALQLPRQEQYLFTQVFEMPDMDSFTQRAFANDYQRYQEWRTAQIRFNTEFGIMRRKHGGPKDPKNMDQSMSLDSEQIEDEEFYNKRIALKILRFRAKPRKDIEAEEFKHASIKDMAKSGQVASFRQKCQATHSSLVSRGSERPSSKGVGGGPRQLSSSHSQKSGVSTKEKLQKDKKLEQESELDTDPERASKIDLEDQKINKQKQRQMHYNEAIVQMNAKKGTPSFEPHYFNSEGGNNFLIENPPKELSPEVVMRMNQRIKRQQQGKDTGSDMKDHDMDDGGMDDGMNGGDKDNPIVALEPEDNLKKGSAFLGSKKNESSVSHHQSRVSAAKGEGQDETFLDPAQVPSLYTQERMYIGQREKEELLRSEEHHIVKTKEFNVYGRLRDEKPLVKSIQKSKAESELNEKFITTECITDRRVKISSMSNRHYAQAPTVENVRKQGQHQMILSAINKKQTFAELINQANSMVTGVLHDPLKRSLNVMPSQAAFGGIRAGTHNEIIVTLKNEDSIGHRITIKPVTDKRIAIQQHEHGVIAPGMIRKISVLIRVPEDEQEDNIKDALLVVTKHETFKIPISAQIHLYENFEEVNKKHIEEKGKAVQNSRVRERLLRKIDDGREASRQASRAELLTKKPDDSEGQIPSDTDRSGKL